MFQTYLGKGEQKSQDRVIDSTFIRMALVTNNLNELILTPMSFIATSNKIIHAGVIPVFAHVETATGNIIGEKIENGITVKTRAIMHCSI